MTNYKATGTQNISGFSNLFQQTVSGGNNLSYTAFSANATTNAGDTINSYTGFSNATSASAGIINNYSGFVVNDVSNATKEIGLYTAIAKGTTGNRLNLDINGSAPNYFSSAIDMRITYANDSSELLYVNGRTRIDSLLRLNNMKLVPNSSYQILVHNTVDSGVYEVPNVKLAGDFETGSQVLSPVYGAGITSTSATSYTYSSGTNPKYLNLTANANITVTLPPIANTYTSSSATLAGNVTLEYLIKIASSSGITVTVSPNSADAGKTIDGSSTFSFSGAYTSKRFYTDGVNWFTN
jgi:hypothetical protein